jgi:hypothetical protein
VLGSDSVHQEERQSEYSHGILYGNGLTERQFEIDIKRIYSLGMEILTTYVKSNSDRESTKNESSPRSSSNTNHSTSSSSTYTSAVSLVLQIIAAFLPETPLQNSSTDDNGSYSAPAAALVAPYENNGSKNRSRIFVNEKFLQSSMKTDSTVIKQALEIFENSPDTDYEEYNSEYFFKVRFYVTDTM